MAPFYSAIYTFAFSRIMAPVLNDGLFVPDQQINARLDEDDGIWLGEKTVEVVLKIAPPVAGYFKRRKLIANQVVEKALEDGGLLISASVGHENQIIPIIRYWIPHIRVVSPDGLQAKVNLTLAEYQDSQ